LIFLVVINVLEATGTTKSISCIFIGWINLMDPVSSQAKKQQRGIQVHLFTKSREINYGNYGI
jgi:hypothetical protein